MNHVDSTFLKVQRILAAQGIQPTILPDNRLRCSFSNISTEAIISVFETPMRYQGDPLTYVHIMVPVLLDVPIRAELIQWVALERPSGFFGRISLVVKKEGDPIGMLMLEHGLTGNFLDPAELQVVVEALLGSADDMDDKLAERFGGQVVRPL